jgi:hypothetical protein
VARKEISMRHISTITALTLCTLLCVSISSAQQTSTIATTTSASVPNLIRYSGTLKDAQGAALASTSPVGVTFAIYNQQDGGAAVWQETQNVTSDANGQYNVILGSTTAAGLPDDLFSQQEQRWLGVQIQGQEEQARVLLVSVPYAFKAHEADTLGGLPASAFIKVPSLGASEGASEYINALQIASGTGAPSSPPAPAGPVSNGPCPLGTAPTTNYVPLWFKPAVNSNIICNSVIFQIPFGAAGNIGIGTIAPAAKLEVNGNINLTNSSQGYQIAGNTMVSTDNSNGDSIYLGHFAGGGEGDVAVGYLANSSGTNNVSIGWESNLAGGGDQNTIIGASAAGIGNSGNQNTFIGAGAGLHAAESSNDIFIGYNTGSQGALMHDIYIDATCDQICDLDHPENNAIRIGTLQTDAYVAGIYQSPIAAQNFPVCIDATGKLGSLAACNPGSSLRFKEQIADMGDSTSRLFQLRPVSFFYKPQYDDGTHALQYGLIAEEVAKIYPEMAVYDKDGQPSGVKYQLLAPMLLNELQKEHAVVASQQDVIKTQQDEIQTLQQQSKDFQQRLSRLESLIANR